MSEYGSPVDVDKNKGMVANGYSPKLPETVQQNLMAYRDNGSLSTRESLFQALRQQNQKMADSMVGSDDIKGYKGIFSALNKAYGVSDDEQGMIDMYSSALQNKKNNNTGQAEMGENANGEGYNIPASNLPGSNTNSTLAILQRR